MNLTTANNKNRFGKAVEFTENDIDYLFEHLNKINPYTIGISLKEYGVYAQANARYKAEGN